MKNATYDFTEDILIVNLCGEIDHHSAAAIRREIDESMKAFHAKNLILDYSGVSFMDSSGIGLAMGRYNRVKELDGSIVIVPGTPYVSRILGLAGLFGLIPKTASRQKALEYIFAKGGRKNEAN